MEATRRLVKSPPELWAELSEVRSLARHLGEFGEIRITRTQPEAVVEWEGEIASGSVRLDASGWGTSVTLTAEPIPPLAPAEPPPPPQAPARSAWFARLLRRRRVVEPEPAAEPPAPPRLDDERASAVLAAALDALGAAHHRPFSR
jgi:hypothetical protein